MGKMRIRDRVPFSIFVDMYRYRSLLWQFTVRNVQARTRGSFLGITWMVLNPLLMMALYSTVFGVIFNGRYGVNPDETALDYALGIFLSLTTFQLIAEVMGASTTIILGNTNIVKRVVFPLEILPVAQVGASIYHFGISIVLVFLGIFIFGHELTATVFLFPLVLLPILLLSLGIGWFFSALGVYVRDLTSLIQFLSLLLLYSSAVFYTIDDVPDSIYEFLKFNPIAHLIQQSRKVVLWNQPLEFEPMAYSYGIAVGVFILGYLTFRKLKSGFADVL